MRIYKKIQPDIVHHITMVCIFLGAFAARLTSINYILNTFSGLGYIFEGKSILKRILRFGVVKSLKFLFHDKKVFYFTENKADLELLRNLGLVKKENSLSLPSAGVDLEKFPYSPENESNCKVLLPARMLYEKGIDEFQRAAKLLKPKYPNVEFLLAGRLDLENPHFIPQALIEKWTQQGHITWLNEVENMPALLREVNIVCLPSYREGLAMSLVEACAVGRAIVATDVPGCRDVVLNRNGLLVPPKNIEKLVEALEILIQNPKLGVEMGKKARKVAEKYFAQEKVFFIIYEQIQKFNLT